MEINEQCGLVTAAEGMASNVPNSVHTHGSAELKGHTTAIKKDGRDSYLEDVISPTVTCYRCMIGKRSGLKSTDIRSRHAISNRI